VAAAENPNDFQQFLFGKQIEPVETQAPTRDQRNS